MQPLGRFERLVDPAAGILLCALAAIVAAGLLELSRTLAETYRGRWFAGNGRDVFHAAAAVVLAAALAANGLPAALAALSAATVLTLPLLLLDSLPARRTARLALLLALLGLAVSPSAFEPLSIVDAANGLARALFH